MDNDGAIVWLFWLHYHMFSFLLIFGWESYSWLFLHFLVFVLHYPGLWFTPHKHNTNKVGRWLLQIITVVITWTFTTQARAKEMWFISLAHTSLQTVWERLANSGLGSTASQHRTGRKLVSFPDPQQDGMRLEGNLHQQMTASDFDIALRANRESIRHGI